MILNFDINGTITAIDSTDDDISHLEASNMIVSKSIFGKIIGGKWIMNNDPFDPINSISFYNHTREINPDYKKVAYSFTNPGMVGEVFRFYCDIIIKNIEEDNLIFPSFLNALKSNPTAKIILRTFGLDGPMIVNLLMKKHNIKKTFGFGKFIRSDEDDILEMLDGTIIVGTKNIGKYLSEYPNDLCIKDDYNYWSVKNKKDRKCGKPMILCDDLQLFFDDNNCVVTYDTNGKDVENKCVYHINTLKAMSDELFYSRIIGGTIQ